MKEKGWPTEGAEERGKGQDDEEDDGADAVAALGCAVCLADLVCCHRTDELKDLGPMEYSFGDFSRGRWALRMANVQRLGRPVPMRGERGLFEPASEVVRAIEAELGRLRDHG